MVEKWVGPMENVREIKKADKKDTYLGTLSAVVRELE